MIVIMTLIRRKSGDEQLKFSNLAEGSFSTISLFERLQVCIYKFCLCWCLFLNKNWYQVERLVEVSHPQDGTKTLVTIRQVMDKFQQLLEY